MITTIIACIIANLLTIAIIGSAIYFIYRKNEDMINELGDKIEEKVGEIKKTISDVVSSIESIKDLIDKLPFNNK